MSEIVTVETRRHKNVLPKCLHMYCQNPATFEVVSGFIKPQIYCFRCNAQRERLSVEGKLRFRNLALIVSWVLFVAVEVAHYVTR